MIVVGHNKEEDLVVNKLEEVWMELIKITEKNQEEDFFIEIKVMYVPNRV